MASPHSNWASISAAACGVRATARNVPSGRFAAAPEQAVVVAQRRPQQLGLMRQRLLSPEERRALASHQRADALATTTPRRGPLAGAEHVEGHDREVGRLHDADEGIVVGRVSGAARV